MRTIRIISTALLLAAFATGCNKEENNYIEIFADNFADNNGKVLSDPYNILAASEWIENEPVNLNNYLYFIGVDSINSHLLHLLIDEAGEIVRPLGEEMCALYPGDSFDGNDVEVSNSGDYREIVLRRLVVRLRDDNRQEMAFPMAAKSAPGAPRLYFCHLSGGIRLTLHNNSGSPIDIASLKIVAQSENQVTNLDTTIDGITFTSRWAVQGPTVPSGPVGTNDDIVNAKYTSEMNFDLRNSSNDNYATIDDNGDLMFCIPITINSVKSLVVTGYSVEGSEIFHVGNSFGQEVSVERNRMYTVPTINVN